MEKMILPTVKAVLAILVALSCSALGVWFMRVLVLREWREGVAYAGKSRFSRAQSPVAFWLVMVSHWFLGALSIAYPWLKILVAMMGKT